MMELIFMVPVRPNRLTVPEEQIREVQFPELRRLEPEGGC
jgi:hypothetical protein